MYYKFLTVITAYNGAHIVQTHDIDKKIFDMTKVGEEIHKNQ